MAGTAIRKGIGSSLGLGLFLLLVFYPLYSEKPVYVGKVVGGIEFTGIKNADPEELKSLLTMRIGQPLERESLNEDVKILFQTGYFSDVILRLQLDEKDRVQVLFEIVEHPRISAINFLGVEELYPTDLKKILHFKEGDVFSLQKVKQGVSALKVKYRDEGFFLAEIWYRIGPVRSSDNTLDVDYIVDEGENIPISKINIIGVEALDPEQILDVMEQKEEGVIEDGVFREGKFEEDKFKIIALAKSQGYLDAEIDPSGTGYEIRWRNPRRPEEGRVVIVTYKINEGEIRYFGGYSLEHDPAHINQENNPPERKIKGPEDLRPIYKSEFLLRYLEFSNADLGEVFDEGKYFRDRGVIQELYSQQGYVFAQVQPHFINFPLTEDVLRKYELCRKIDNPANDQERQCREEGKLLHIKALRIRLLENPDQRGRVLRHVHFTVRENGLAYIENIIIKGMVKTQEHVIRRQLLIKEGQLFNSALVKRSREKIANLGYFKEVNLKSTPGSDESKMNLIIDVEEQPTGTISMGGGYGTVSGFSIFTEVGENNLNGTGQRISGRLDYGPLRRYIKISWTEPWIYETCQDSTGNFWREKQKAFDEAPDTAEIVRIAESLRNEYRGVGRAINGYVIAAGDDHSIEALDRIKVRIRYLLHDRVAFEEECYRSVPRPWSLTLSALWSSQTITNVPTISLGARNITSYTEESSYQKTSVGLIVGTTHTFFLNWAHYHSYAPSWSVASRPSALVSNEYLREVELGWQFKSSLRNGLVYDTRDSVFNPTTGISVNISAEIVGQLLGGQDHFNRYHLVTEYYWWWFDYTLGGLIRKNVLRRWRVVQEFRFSGTFTHETAPFSGHIFKEKESIIDRLNPFRRPKQDKELNPFIEPDDRLILGGPESIRGYDYQFDQNFPTSWYRFYGGSHMLLASTELRFPIEPTVLWFVFFFDAGSLFNNLGELVGDPREYVQSYEEELNTQKAATDPLLLYLSERYNLITMSRYPYAPISEWNNPYRTVLSQRNIALDRTLYSWGFGLRVQIPVLPLRLYLAQKMYHAGGLRFKPIPGQKKYEFVFAIGDIRF